MTIFRRKETQSLYTIQLVKMDGTISSTNKGVWAFPYKHQGDLLIFPCEWDLATQMNIIERHFDRVATSSEEDNVPTHYMEYEIIRDEMNDTFSMRNYS